jgi:hypothetical protein
MITDFETFAADRKDLLRATDKELAPYVVKAYPTSDWETVVQAASQAWLSEFDRLTPDTAQWKDALQEFQDLLLESLNKTNPPDEDGPNAYQLDRITEYVSTATINDATRAAAAATGFNLRWLSQRDDDVRTTHVAADGQERPPTESFDVGGAALRYPGDPRGPLNEVMNCRCVLAPVGGGATVAAATVVEEPVVDDVDVDAEEETEIPDDEELVDDAVEIPWHAVLAPEEKPTGDGRMFAKDSLSWRELPLPLLYQHATDVGHGGSVRVGRIDEIWKNDAGEARARGMFNNTEEAQHVIEGLVDGSIRGVSVDVDDVALDYDRSTDLATDINGGLAVFNKARIAGLTIVAIPAYQEAYIGLGPDFEDEMSQEQLAALSSCGCADEILWEHELDPVDAGLLERIIDFPAVEYAISEEPWDGSSSNYTDDQWYQATLVHTNNGSKVKSDNKLPILTPSGALSRAGVHAAASRLNQVDAPAAAISAAKGKLRSAYEQLGEDPPDAITAAAFAVGTKDGPGWITHPKATGRIRRYWVRGKGAAKIRWGQPGDFNRCRKQLGKYVQNPEWLAGLCANMHKEAIGIWPGMERGGRHSNLTAPVPAVTLTAAAGSVTRLAAAVFTDPKFDGPTPITIVDEEIAGHLATWGTCHIGIPGICTTAPHSSSNYAYYRTGVVDTDQGPVPVGQITMDTGHANLKASPTAAAAHYDNTGSVVADVAAGEDAHGIWVHGVLRPDISDEKRAALAAASLSGDWREIRGSLELVAALAVNVPGFPVTRTGLAASGTTQTALVAAGVLPPAGKFSSRDAEEIAAIARTAVQEYRHQEQVAQRAQRLAPTRERVKALRILEARERLTQKG